MPTYKLKPIKGKKNFSLLFNSGKRFFDSDAMAVARFAPASSADASSDSAGQINQQVVFYAVSVRKKVAKKAVVRNRIKRLLRESLRLVAAEFDSQGKALPVGSIMLFWRNAPAHPMLVGLWDVLPQVRKIFQKACVYYSDKELTKKQETEINEENINPADKSL